MNPDELRAPETDDEPWIVRRRDLRVTDDPAHDLDGPDPFRPRPDLRGVIYTVALLAGLTLAAIAWRMLRG